MGDKLEFMKMVFDEYRSIGEDEIPAGSFTYAAPEGVQVLDLGPMMQQMQGGQ
jgi:hypothetical protein